MTKDAGDPRPAAFGSPWKGAKALVRQHQFKFGPMMPGIGSRIQAAAPAQLALWLTRILTAATPGEVFP